MTASAPGESDAALTLVERADLLDLLERYRSEAAGGAGRFVLIRGEAGIGKTALARAFLGGLPDTASVVETHCEDLSTPSPFAALHEAIPTFGPALGRLLTGDATRTEVAAWILGALSSRGLKIWLLEDLQWADDATLDIVRYLGRRIDRLSVLMIGTYREEERPRPALSFVLGDLATTPTVRQVEVLPLSLDGVAVLAHGRHPEPDHLHRLTSGNPFYVTEVLTAGAGPVPVSVRDAIRARLSRLDARAGRALQAAAVLGSTVEPWLLAAVSGEDLPGIDDCLAAGVVRSESGRIAFRHELTRVTVLEDLPVFQGIGLHRRALDALRLGGETNDARLAYHAEGAADASAVLRHGGAAATRSLALHAHREAAEQLRRCMRFAPATVDESRVDLLEKFALSLFMTGELEEADAMQSQAVAACREIGDRVRQGQNIRRLARQRLFRCGAHDALPLALEALALLEPLDAPREVALAHAAIGHVHMVAQRAAEVTTWSQRALELGRRLNDAEVVSYAINDLGSAELLKGVPAGREKLIEALQVAKEARLAEHIDRALINLSEASLHNRELDQATMWLGETAEFNAASQINLCDLDSIWAGVHVERGQWDDAVRSAELCLSRPKPGPVERTRAAIVLAAIATRRGAGDAPDLVSRADAFADRGAQPDLQIRWPLASLHAEIAWLAGDMASVIGELRAVHRQAVEREDPWAAGDLGRWLWRAGELHRLDDVAAQPYALQVKGDWQGAMRAWQRHGVPYEAALCLADSPDPVDLTEAHSRLVGLGAEAVARHVAVTIRGLGASVPRGPRRSTRANQSGLTTREAEIAGLAAAGLTNREIADQLVLTQKTVSHHMSAVLGKLGARRRADIAQLLTRSPAPH